MDDQATSETPADDEAEVERKPEKQMNPVRRAHLFAKFVDGKWWTPAGMAAALGSSLPGDLAVRYYRYKLSSDVEGRQATELVQAARKKCVQDVLKGIPATLAETKEEDGQIFYRLKQRTVTRVTTDVKPAVQTTAGATETGLTTAGVLAAITDLGGKCDIETLIAKLTPVMVSDEKLMVWAKKTAASRNRKSETITLDEARRWAVRTACERSRSNHPVKIYTTVTIEYTPAKDEPEGSAAEPPDKSAQ